MITTIAEHTIDLSLLSEKAKIMDIGCRGFQFANFFREIGHDVYSIDIDIFEGTYFRLAITDKTGFVGIKKTHDPQATHVCNGSEVLSETIASFSELVEVPFWDVIKIDVEGSEREIINSMDRPYAKQLSIEFHLHTGVYNETEVYRMVSRLQLLGYDVIQHNKEPRHGLCANYWDSLFVLNRKEWSEPNNY